MRAVHLYPADQFARLGGKCCLAVGAVYTKGCSGGYGATNAHLGCMWHAALTLPCGSMLTRATLRSSHFLLRGLGEAKPV